MQTKRWAGKWYECSWSRDCSTRHKQVSDDNCNPGDRTIRRLEYGDIREIARRQITCVRFVQGLLTEATSRRTMTRWRTMVDSCV